MVSYIYIYNMELFFFNEKFKRVSLQIVNSRDEKMGLYKEGTIEAYLSQGKQPQNTHTHIHTSSCKSPFESASVGVCAFVCSRLPLSLYWQLQPQLGEFVSECKSAALEISCLSFSQWQDTEMTRALVNRISLAAMVVASPTSEVRISPVTEVARINLVVWVAMAVRTNPEVAMEINPVAMAAKISPAMEEEEEGQTKACPVVAVIRMQQTLRKTKMAMETPVIMVPTLR